MPPTDAAAALGPPARGRQLNRREFFSIIVGELRRSLPAELSRFRHHENSMLLKVDYGNRRVHYEVWPDATRGHVEVGLHFEDGPASTAAYLAFFDARIVEIKHLLGERIELERWTASWGHLFEVHELVLLDRRFAETIASRLAAQIAILEPMVHEAGVPPKPHVEHVGSSGRWPMSKRSRSS